MEIGSLSEYLEALKAVEDYFYSNTYDELLEEFKNLFPLGSSIYDIDENYLGDVMDWGIQDNGRFILTLEYNEQTISVQVTGIERTLPSKPEIPVTKIGIPRTKSTYTHGMVLAHRIKSKTQ